MILADKIMMLRKKNGWSQEELAEKLDVTRQSVSKWEGAQSVPDLGKILAMSQIFGVTTDYLLKDELEEEEISQTAESYEQSIPMRRVSMEEASEFLRIKRQSAGKIATATALCILSPVCLILLGVFSEEKRYGISESLAAGVGLVILLTMVAIAVGIFIFFGMKASEYEYLEKEVFETEYGVDGMVRNRKSDYRGAYIRSNIIGTCLCIMAAAPLFAELALFGENENDIVYVAAIAVLLILVAVGVWFFVNAGVIWGSMQRLLQEGDYTPERKRHEARLKPLGSIYWPIITAIYLAVSFTSDRWDRTWIIWPVAGVLYAAISAIYHVVGGKKE